MIKDLQDQFLCRYQTLGVLLLMVVKTPRYNWWCHYMFVCLGIKKDNNQKKKKKMIWHDKVKGNRKNLASKTYSNTVWWTLNLPWTGYLWMETMEIPNLEKALEKGRCLSQQSR